MKLVLIHPERGAIGEVQGGYSLHIPYPGYAQQDPDIYWQTACRITKEALSQGVVKPEEIAGIIFAAQWKGIIPVDDGMRPLHEAILWLDRRAAAQAQQLNDKLGAGRFHPTDYWPKLLWLKQERPETWAKTHKILEINTWMKYRASGTVTSDVTSHFTASADPERQAWYDQILAVCDIPAEMFPPMVASDALVGHVTEKAAAELGLQAGTPVFGGCGDIPAIARGVGCERPGDAHIYLGTSGWLGITAEKNIWPDCRTSAFTYNSMICFLGLESVGLTTKWSLDNLFSAEHEKQGNGVFDWLNDNIRDIPPGSNGLIALTALYGENKPFDQSMRAAFFRLEGTHTRFHMHRALMEGICYLFRHHKECYEQSTVNRLTQLKAAGGGAKNPLWMQMMADVLDCTVEVCPQPQYAGAMGAARCVMAGLGMRQQDTPDGTVVYTPNREARVVYDAAYSAFLKAVELAAEIGRI